MHGTKKKNWNSTSVITPIPATKQKDRRLGISHCIPRKKANDSHRAAMKIEGPISLSAKASLNLGSVMCLGTTYSALEIKKMLSTPIAKIKNGTTSNDIRVSGTSAYMVSPIEDPRAIRTTQIPSAPSENLLCTRSGNVPRETPTYSNMITYETIATAE